MNWGPWGRKELDMTEQLSVSPSEAHISNLKLANIFIFSFICCLISFARITYTSVFCSIIFVSEWNYKSFEKILREIILFSLEWSKNLKTVQWGNFKCFYDFKLTRMNYINHFFLVNILIRSDNQHYFIYS